MNRADGGTDYVNKYTNIKDGSLETDEERKLRTGMSSLKITDEESAAVQQTPNRISLELMESRVLHVQYLYPAQIPHMTIAVVLLDNGFGLVGKSAPADAGNFNEELGKKFAYEDAIRQAWPLFAFALREHLSVPNGEAP